jgi:HD-like signal output (HDOD) protein
MKRRILFVHESPATLTGFQKAVLSMEPVWDMDFAASGPTALSMLAASPFDAVVADIVPRDAKGLEFLNQVRDLHPGAVRFAIADQQDKDAVLECARQMHQCLPRPCQARMLIAGIRRALSLDGWLQDVKLKQLVASMPPLPSMPSVYQEVVRELNDSRGSAEKVTEILSQDMGITARLLQTVNSAYYGQSRRITHVGEAVLILGTEAVRSVVLCLQTYNHFDRSKPLPFPIDRLWAHSMMVGERARRIALLQTHQPEVADEAFTAGLMHDIGILVLASNLPDGYKQIWQQAAEQKRPLWQVEQEVLGATHAGVGAYLLARWGLPITLIEAVAHHHAPREGFQDGFTVLTAVHAADALVSAESPSCEGPPGPEPDLAYLKSLDLSERLDTWRKCGQLTPGKGAGGRTKRREPQPAPSKFPPVSAKQAPVAMAETEWRRAIGLAAALVVLGIVFWWVSR